MSKRSNQIAQLEARGFDECRSVSRGQIHVGCSQCQASAINGIASHESGCRNQTFECKGCNARVSRRGAYCEDCA